MSRTMRATTPQRTANPRIGAARLEAGAADDDAAMAASPRSRTGGRREPIGGVTLWTTPRRVLLVLRAAGRLATAQVPEHALLVQREHAPVLARGLPYV